MRTVKKSKVVMVLRTEGATLTIYNTANKGHIKLVGQFVKLFRELEEQKEQKNVPGQS